MRAIEHDAMASGRVSGLELMERAGQGVLEAIFETWPELRLVAPSERGASPSRTPEYFEREEAKKAVVLCGPGNNGGDGFVIARLLKELGWQVTLFFYGRQDRLPADARVNYDRWIGVGGEVRMLMYPDVSMRDVEAFENAAYGRSGTALIIDAVFGIGLNRAIDGLSQLFAYNDVEVGVGDRLTPARHVAVDVPSGMFSDNPQAPTHLGWFLADLTVTFHALKEAHVHPLTKASCGRVIVRDIGL